MSDTKIDRIEKRIARARAAMEVALAANPPGKYRVSSEVFDAAQTLTALGMDLTEALIEVDEAADRAIAGELAALSEWAEDGECRTCYGEGLAPNVCAGDDMLLDGNYVEEPCPACRPDDHAREARRFAGRLARLEAIR